MEKRVTDFFRGYVKIRITGNSYDRFLNLCAYHGIRLWNLKPSGEAYEAYLLRRDFKRLKTVVRKSRTSIVITERRGLPFFIHRNRKRGVYVAGIAAAMLFMFWLSAHIWNISIDGNVSQTDDVIFEYLTASGVRHGMWKNAVDCKELAAEIRSYFSEFAWVSAELRGTRLLIHVKEGIWQEELTEEEENPSSLAASCAGTVESILVRRGTPLVQAGDEVEKGTLLVSGALPIYNDSGEIASYQYTAADADVVIRRTRSYRDELALNTTKIEYTGREKTSWLFRLGETPFALPDSFDRFDRYDTISELTQLRLSENFYLPVYVQKFTAREYETVEAVYTKEESRALLAENFRCYLEDLQKSGVTVYGSTVAVTWNEEAAVAEGTLTTGESAVSRIKADAAQIPPPTYG